VIIENVHELKPRGLRLSKYNEGINDFRNCVENISSERIISWHKANGRESDKSLSKAINSILLQNLQESGWELNWSFCPSIKSNHATFVAAKEFESRKPIRFAMDVGSRHSNEALGYLVKGQLAKRREGKFKIHQVDAHIVLTFTQQCLEWGKWDTSVYSFEKLAQNLPLIESSITTPVWLIGVGAPRDLVVSHSLAKTLKLEKLQV
jgi:hypothetical protein